MYLSPDNIIWVYVESEEIEDRKLALLAKAVGLADTCGMNRLTLINAIRKKRKDNNERAAGYINGEHRFKHVIDISGQERVFKDVFGQQQFFHFKKGHTWWYIRSDLD